MFFIIDKVRCSFWSFICMISHAIIIIEMAKWVTCRNRVLRRRLNYPLTIQN